MRAVTTTEPEWDDEQQSWMLALAKYRASLCQRCGGDLHETTDPKNWGRYVPVDPLMCHRCDGLLVSEEQHQKKERSAALMHRVELRTQRG